MRFTKEMINERLKPRGINLVGDFTRVRSKTQFECDHGHIWTASPNNVLGGTGCPHCNGMARLTTATINKKLEVMNSDIRIIGDYINNYTKSIFTHLICEHNWEANPSNILAGKGCPNCVERHFNTSKEAWEYILDFGYFLKFGITNNINRRLEDHKKNGEYKVVHIRHHIIGQLALDWENNIKRTHGGRYVTKEQCPDGYTETLPTYMLESLIR